jgi:regulator of RNase E activity RraA
VVSHANFRIVRTGVPVQILGAVIRPGDVLHGDENGVLVVPQMEQPAKLIAAVEEVRRRERELMEFVRGDTFSLDGLRKRIVE